MIAEHTYNVSHTYQLGLKKISKQVKRKGLKFWNSSLLLEPSEKSKLLETCTVFND